MEREFSAGPLEPAEGIASVKCPSGFATGPSPHRFDSCLDFSHP